MTPLWGALVCAQREIHSTVPFGQPADAQIKDVALATHNKPVNLEKELNCSLVVS